MPSLSPKDLERKLAGKHRQNVPLQTAFHVLLAFLKTYLLFVGGSVVYHHGLAMLNYEHVVVENGNVIMWIFIAMNVAEIIEQLLTDNCWTIQVHHCASIFTTWSIYMYGSDRLVAFVLLSLSTEVVAPFYQMNYILKFWQKGCTHANLVVLNWAWYVSIYCRQPIGVYSIIFHASDLIHWFWYGTFVRTLFFDTDDHSFVLLNEMRPLMSLFCFGLTLILIQLDLIWNKAVARQIDGIQSVLAWKKQPFSSISAEATVATATTKDSSQADNQNADNPGSGEASPVKQKMRLDRFTSPERSCMQPICIDVKNK